MAREWHGTNHIEEIPSDFDRVPDFDPRTGDHLWTIFTMYRWGGPQVDTPQLDRENLLAVRGPGCFHCEQPYTDRLAKRRCKGHGE